MVLRMKYDDGFVAYLNGTRIVERQRRRPIRAWNAGATGQHDDASAVTWVSFDVGKYINKLKAGNNILAIHGLNSGLGQFRHAHQRRAVAWPAQRCRDCRRRAQVHVADQAHWPTRRFAPARCTTANGAHWLSIRFRPGAQARRCASPRSCTTRPAAVSTSSSSCTTAARSTCRSVGTGSTASTLLSPATPSSAPASFSCWRPTTTPTHSNCATPAWPWTAGTVAACQTTASGWPCSMPGGGVLSKWTSATAALGQARPTATGIRSS